MGKLGVLFYEVKLKDSMSTGLSTIEQKIKKLSAEIKPKIVAKDLKEQIKIATSGMGAVQVKVTAYKQGLRDSLKEALTNYSIKATVGVKAADLRTSITNALSTKTDFKARVSVYATDLRKSIKDAIALESYKAKVVADTTGLTSAIQKQVSQQTYTASVTLTTTSSTQDKKKKTQEVTDTKTKKKQDEPIKIKVDASSAPKDIQTAINKGTYTAKVNANVEALTKAIENAIPKEKNIKINGTVSTSGGSTSGGTTSGSTPSKISDSDIKRNQAQAAKAAQAQGVSKIKGNAIKYYTDRINEQTRGLNDLEVKLKRVNALIARKGSASGIDNALVERLEARRKTYASDLAHLESARAKIESKKNWTDESLRAQMAKSSEAYIASQAKQNQKVSANDSKTRDKALTDYQEKKSRNAVLGATIAQRMRAKATAEENQALKDQAKNLQEVLALRNQAAKAKAKIDAEDAKQARKSRENDIRAALAEKDRKDKAQSQALKFQTSQLSDKLNEKANAKVQSERQQKLNYYRDRINEYERGVKELQARMARMQSLSFKRGDSSQLTSEALKRAQSRIELYRTKIAGLSDEMSKISLGKWDGKTDHTNRQIGLEKALSNQVAAQEKANREREKLIEKYKSETAKNYERGLRNAQSIAEKRQSSSVSQVANVSTTRPQTRVASSQNTASQTGMISADEKAYSDRLRASFANRASLLREEIDKYRKLVDAYKSLNNRASGTDSRFLPKSYLEDAKKKLSELEQLHERFQRLSQKKSFTLPRIQSLDGYGSTPSNHAEMQKKWEAHFAWKDELAAQEKSRRAEEERVAAIKKAVQQRQQAAASARTYATDMQRVASEMNNVGSRSGWLHDQLQNVFSMYGVQQFLQNLIMIGGEFEKQRIALGSIFKNTAKGNETFEQIKQWSVKSPFTFSNLTAYTKQLASFGFQYRDVFETTKKLADISAGVGVDMGRIILAYGQVYTAHYLRGQELRQFTEAGIPMVDELSKVLTERMGRQVDAGEVFKLISDKQVEFNDVKKVIDKLTGEGGTFYKMQEKQSESLAGRWTNLKDAVEIMYSDIESANNGWLKGSISLLTKLALSWKGVGAMVGTVAGAYGLLALKNRIVNATNAFNINAVAKVNSQTAAIQKQVDAYNQLASAITRKNTQESVYGGNGKYHSAVTWREKVAARDMATKAALNGVSPRELTPIYTGERKKTVNEYGRVVWDKNAGLDKSFQEGGSVAKANKLVRTINVLKRQTEGSASVTKKLALAWNQVQLAGWKAGLSIKSFAATMAATLSSMLPMMAISGAISGIMYLIESRNEEVEKQKQLTENAKASYKELMDFIDENPIEMKIKGGDYGEMKQLIEKYQEEVRNSPINIDFAITHSENISDLAEQLTYLKTKIEEVARAEAWMKENGNGVVKSIQDDTNGWFDEGYAKNIKDYYESVQAYSNEIAKMSDSDADNFLSQLASFSHGTEGTEEMRKKAEALRLELIRLKKDGDMEGFWTKAASSSVSALARFDAIMRVLRNLRASVINDKETKDSDADTAFEKVQEKLSHIDGALVDGKLTDFGHDIMINIAKGIGENEGLVDAEMEQLYADLESRSSAAFGATWQTNTQAMNALMDQIKQNCRELFQGQDLSNGFSQQQRDAIQRIISEAPPYCHRFQNEWQRLLNQRTLIQRVAVEFNATDAPGFKPTSAQSVFQQYFKGKLSDTGIAALAPGANDDYETWKNSLVSKYKKNAEGLKARESQKNKNKKINSEYKSIQTNQTAVRTVLGTVDAGLLAQLDEELNKKTNKKTGNSNGNSNNNKKEEQDRKEENRLRKEFQQIKRVREMYEKLRELYGDEGAIDKIRKSGLIRADLIPTDVHSMEDFLKKYRAIMKKFYNSYKATTEGTKELNSQVAQDLLNLQFDQEKEALDKAVSTLETQLERAGDAWKRYKDLLSEGMNMPLAKFMVYGGMGSYNMVESDDTGSQRLSMLRERAAKHIEEKTKTSPSDYNMDRYLGMNEEELKTEFGNNEKVTKGLWAIVKTYQEVAKTIRSENDKLISQLYKDSLSYASQIEGIARKHKKERATIKEKETAYAPAKQRYDRAVQQGANIEGRLKYQQGLAESSNEYKKWELANTSYELDKGALAWHDEQVKEGKEPSTNRKDLQKQVNESKTAADTAWNVYIQTDAYKGIAPLEEEQAKNQEEQKIAKEKLSDTLPPEVANGLLTQSRINERNEKSEISQKVIEGSDGYIELFNNIYNLASKTANEIADNLIDTLDEKLAHGEINQETYTNMRNEISQKRDEVYEKGTDSKNAKLWQVGIGGITKNKIQQAQSEQETAGKEMNSIQAQIDQNNAAITSEEKAQRIASIKQQLDTANQEFLTASGNGDEAAKMRALGQIGELNQQLIDTQNTKEVTPEERTTRGAVLQKQYDDAKERYEAADQAGNAAAKKQAKQDMIQGGFGMAANMGQNLTQFRDTLGSTMDAFGMNTDQNEGFQKFSTAVDVMSDVSSGMSNAMQSMMSGDFVGAAFSIIETPMNIANAFAKLHDKKLDIQINQSKQLMEEVKTASEDLKNAIQSSLGAEDAKNRALSRQGEMAQILSDAGVKDTEGAGFVYGMVSGKTSGSDLINQNRNKYYGKDGKVTDQEYRRVFSFGKFLGNTLALGTSTAIGAIPATGYTTYKAISGATTLKRNEEAKAFDRMADALEKAQFGKHDQVSVYGAEYASLLEQRKQAEYQMKMEQDKSNTDDDKIKEYKNQIKDLTKQIHEYMTNLAKELYGIDFSSWANKLGDALTNAFRNGEDAAAAFHDAVSDIMADLVKNMIITDAIKPMFTKLEETLFGKDDDMSGMLDVNDMEGSIQKAVPYISSFFKDVENSVPGWEKLYDVLNEASGGIVKKTSSSSSSLSGSIKGITEETSTLLASYINAIRLDVSVNRKTFKDLAEVTIPKMSVIAENQLRQLNVIAEQTTKIEENTRKNYEAVELIRSYISSVSTTTSGGKAIRMKA